MKKRQKMSAATEVAKRAHAAGRSQDFSRRKRTIVNPAT